MAAVMAMRALSLIWVERRSVRRRAVAAGQMSMAMTRIEPTASNEATAQAAVMIMRRVVMSPAWTPWVVASPGSKDAMRSSLWRARVKMRTRVVSVRRVETWVGMWVRVSIEKSWFHSVGAMKKRVSSWP